jgi:hypothetical protein
MKLQKISRKIKIGEKGQGWEIALIVFVAIITIIATMLLSIFLLKIHLVRVVEIEYGYDNADLTLLTLLSDRKIYKGLSLYVAGLPDNLAASFSRSGVEDMVKSRLSELVPGECYKLSYSAGEISSSKLSNKQCETKYSASAYIALPYGRDIEKLTLEMDTIAVSPSSTTTTIGVGNNRI